MTMRSTKQDWLTDLVNEIPLDTADYDYLVSKTLPRLRTRDIKALSDALMLARRDGRKLLTGSAS